MPKLIRHVSRMSLFSAALWFAAHLFLFVPGASAQTDARGVKAPEREAGAGRVALVLGNAEYASITPLKNSANDAKDIAEKLRRLGFEVILQLDQPREEMYKAVRSFSQKTSGADVALLFYAGHGVEVTGENYLIPVDASSLEGNVRIDQEAVPLGQILQAMQQATMQVVVLDACRSNPFPNVVESGSSGGWAMPSAELVGGTLVAYGTAPGDVASDNPMGRNGLFTEALLAEIEKPGIEAAEVMRRVTRRVREASNDTQSPWLSSSYVLPFYFTEPDSERPSASVESARLSDIETWARKGRDAYGDKNYEAALTLLQQAARAGHTDSQYYLGTMYLGGLGVPEDQKQAADWFELASLQGHPRAQYFLGGMYGGGFGRSRDDIRAADLYQRAAEQGLSVGQFRLGVVYESGRGRSEDLDEALRWYLQAARQGHGEARAALQRVADDGHDRARAMLRLLENTPRD